MQSIKDLTLDLPLEILLDDKALTAASEGGIVSISAPPEFFDLALNVLKDRMRAIRARGLRVDTCHLPYGGGNRAHSACSEIDDVRDATIRMWQHYLPRLGLCGVKSTPLHTGGCMHTGLQQWLRDRLHDTLSRLLPFAKDAGVTIALENTFYNNPPPFAGMENLRPESTEYLNDDCDLLAKTVRAWNDPAISVCFDAGHAHILGHTVLSDFMKVKPLVTLYHLHDNNGVRDLHYTPGLGTLPFGALLLQMEPGDAPLYIEVFRDPDPIRHASLFSLENVLETLRLTKRAFGYQ